ncbi:unnamed protein product [Spirodela intermedia]|uniref:J domain-containing protein n=1 Tax=Spirodela intermedia TaxID=51605 RepID=A0A7I8K2T9_SPIIN|nr:unnamed protein product [Spirodela intermedia]
MAETLYDVLEVGAGATAQEIKAAYRRLARACHPDVVRADRRGGGGSAAEFMRIHAAYATLSDPDKRAEYDRRVVTTLAMRRRPPFGWESSSSASFYSPASPGSSSPSSRYRQRTWETDQCW